VGVPEEHHNGPGLGHPPDERLVRRAQHEVEAPKSPPSATTALLRFAAERLN